jgi:nitric oxide reductase subunit C
LRLAARRRYDAVVERRTPVVVAGLVAFAAFWSALAYTDPGPPAAAAPPAGAVAGKRVWLRENCQSCHQIFGLGGYLGPDLTNVADRRGREYMAVVLREGRGEMPRLALADDDVERLIDYLEYVGRTGRFPLVSPARGFNN